MERSVSTAEFEGWFDCWRELVWFCLEWPTLEGDGRRFSSLDMNEDVLNRKRKSSYNQSDLDALLGKILGVLLALPLAWDDLQAERELRECCLDLAIVYGPAV
jgi:hypothetical protein